MKGERKADQWLCFGNEFDIKKPSLTGGCRCQYIINTTADVKIASIFWINQNITQKILAMHVAY